MREYFRYRRQHSGRGASSKDAADTNAHELRFLPAQARILPPAPVGRWPTMTTAGSYAGVTMLREYRSRRLYSDVYAIFHSRRHASEVSEYASSWSFLLRHARRRPGKMMTLMTAMRAPRSRRAINDARLFAATAGRAD